VVSRQPKSILFVSLRLRMLLAFHRAGTAFTARNTQRLHQCLPYSADPLRGNRAYSLANLREAVRLVRAKVLSAGAAAKLQRVPDSTLRDWLKLPHCLTLPPAIGHPTVLDREDEQRLEEYLIACEEGFMGLSRDAAGAVAAQMLAERNKLRKALGQPIKTFGTENGLPGRDWWQGIRKRRPRIALRRPSRLTQAQARAADPAALKAYIWNIGQLLEGVPASHIGNLDEMDLHLTNTTAPVITSRENSEPPRALISSFTQHVTYSSTIIADGFMLPPNFIFVGKTAPDAGLAGPNPIQGTAIATTGSFFVEFCSSSLPCLL
jgi:hypothetical protein